MKVRRQIFSIWMLAVYCIVMLHSIVPHHHHQESLDNKCCLEKTIGTVQNHTLFCTDHSCHHEDEDHSPCHFDVDPIPGKSLAIDALYLLAVVLDSLVMPEQELDVWPDLLVPALQQVFHEISGVRGPPFYV